MRQLKTLKTVKDSFSLFNDGRQLSANKRNYIVKGVQSMLANQRTQELLRVGEAYGYYGHQPRQRANKLDIGETEVIMVQGKPVVVENVPSNRTKSITCDDNGVITHEEEFFDTPTGKIALSLWESGAGGWSWATGGRDTPQASLTTSFHGMDYVLQPNYLSLDHPSMMLESANASDMILESLQNHGGFEYDDAMAIADSIQSASLVPNTADLENHVMYLESVNNELRDQIDSRNSIGDMLLEAANSLPVYLSDSQRKAIGSMASEDDVKVVQALFESLGGNQSKTLPTGGYEPASTVTRRTSEAGSMLKRNAIDFDPSTTRFS